MQIIKNPKRQEWSQLLQRPYYDNSAVLQSVQHILSEVKSGGDEALRQFARRFDGVELSGLQVSEAELDQAEAKLSPALKQAIQQAQANVKTFHAAQLHPIQVVQTAPVFPAGARA